MLNQFKLLFFSSKTENLWKLKKKLKIETLSLYRNRHRKWYCIKLNCMSIWSRLDYWRRLQLCVNNDTAAWRISHITIMLQTWSFVRRSPREWSTNHVSALARNNKPPINGISPLLNEIFLLENYDNRRSHLFIWVNLIVFLLSIMYGQQF